MIKLLRCINCSKILTDAATGLYNRKYWEQIMNNASFNPRIKNFSLIIIDIDNLKNK